MLDKINSAGVLHGDARYTNFIIVEKQPYKDENWKIDAYEKTAYILDFGFSRKFYFPQVEDLKPDPLQTWRIFFYVLVCTVYAYMTYDVNRKDVNA